MLWFQKATKIFKLADAICNAKEDSADKLYSPGFDSSVEGAVLLYGLGEYIILQGYV